MSGFEDPVESDEDERKRESRDSSVYHPEDGHKFVESTWPSVRGCLRCGYGKHFHLPTDGAQK